MADASAEPKLAQVETELATKPLHGDEAKKEEPATETPAVCAIHPIVENHQVL